MDTSLYKVLREYADKDTSRLHMPGHKGRDIYGLGDMWKYDVTEVETTDNLLNPTGPIKAMELEYSRIYESVASLISTQGATSCIQTMLTLAATFDGSISDGKKIIVDRNVHISAVNTMALLNMNPVWLYGDYGNNECMPKLISASQVESMILEHDDAVAVYITSPNYFGIFTDIKAIAEICKKYSKLLLVDNAHGAHLKFVGNQDHPIALGADCCSDSLHKTLPVLTGGAILHIGNEMLVKNAKKIFSMYSSTSPSYLTMLSVDLLIDYIKYRATEDYKNLVCRIDRLKTVVAEQGFIIPVGEKDRTRLVIGLGNMGTSTDEIVKIFRNNKVEPEYENGYWIVFIFSPQNRNIDFERVEFSLKEIGKQFRQNNSGRKIDLTPPRYENQIVMGLREAVFRQSEKIPIEDAVGRVASQAVTTCPPGVPIIMPGEIVSRETIRALQQNGIYFLDVVVK
jgi:arginine/lysine/ornithine decarboxylase